MIPESDFKCNHQLYSCDSTCSNQYSVRAAIYEHCKACELSALPLAFSLLALYALEGIMFVIGRVCITV